MAELRVVIAGAGGRMGSALIAAMVERGDMVLHAALDRTDSPAVGKDAGQLAGVSALGVPVSTDLEEALVGAECIIDFTAPAVSVLLAERCAPLGLAHVIGTTGLTADEDWAVAKAGAAGARIVKSGNFSLGVNVLAGLVRQAAQMLPDYDLEILEMHHNRKVDAPSGTALLLGQAAAEGRAVTLAEHSTRARDGHTGPRQAGSIGFAALRGGSVVGEHTVYLAGPAERIELTHRAEGRSIFAHGALKAALWAREQPPGLYSMADVLGFPR